MRKKTVLVAEDVNQTRAILRSILKRANCEVIKEITDGRKVVTSIQAARPDIVFLDLNLPGKDGFEILAEIEKQRLHQCVWIISSSNDEETKRRAHSAGARGFITKPFTSQAVEEAIEQSTRYIANDKPITTMVVDDEPAICQVMKETLATLGCETVRVANNGGEAIQYLLNTELIPEITFLDIEMKDTDGLTTLKQIRDRKVNTFAVIISAHSTVDNVKKALTMGANGFVVKPITRDKIQQILEKYKESLYQKSDKT